MGWLFHRLLLSHTRSLLDVSSMKLTQIQAVCDRVLPGLPLHPRPKPQRERRARPCLAAAELDPIERAVGWLFGRNAVDNRRPIRMARIEGSALDQQYEANTEMQAEPVPGDSDDVARIRPLLAQTVLEKEPLRRGTAVSFVLTRLHQDLVWYDLVLLPLQASFLCKHSRLER